TSSNTAIATVSNTGLVTGIAAGSVTITYTNNNGCSTTTTVTVNNCIDAVNDNFGNVNPGNSTASVILNDFNNGSAAVIGTAAGQVSIKTATDAAGTAGAWPAGFTLNADGTITVAAGTAAGTYTLYYTICNQTAGSPCDTAAVTLTVPPTIDAINGSQTVNSGSTGTSVLANDTIQNGTAGSVTLGATGNATISQTNTTNAGVNIDTATGNVVVSPGTPAGTYTITYEICTKATPVTCDTATEVVTVPNLLDAVNDTYGSVTPGTSTISVIANDKNIAGTAAVIGGAAGQVSIKTATDAAGTAGAWPAGFTLNTDGTITVAANVSGGTFTLYYTICNQTAGSPCDTATVTLFIPLCYKPAQTTGTALDTNHGITALGRAGDDNSNWPMVRKGAWTVLEAKTKGFVVNRLTDAQITAIPNADLREGMMVYNITQDCLQINIDGTATGWRCFNTQTCPD
ncbi:Ig-like domain-containing protein, partial [Cloacibacterium normanense]